MCNPAAAQLLSPSDSELSVPGQIIVLGQAFFNLSCSSILFGYREK